MVIFRRGTRLKFDQKLYDWALAYVVEHNPRYDEKLPDRKAVDEWTVDVYTQMQGQTWADRKEIFSKLSGADYTVAADIKNADADSTEEPNLITSIARYQLEGQNLHY